MIKRSLQHLRDNNERYFQHQRFAIGYGVDCLKAGLMAIIHGIIPACFETTASEKVQALATRKRPSDTYENNLPTEPTNQ